jgi:hypothetical protein
MNETHPPRRILRSIGAVFAGFVVVVVLSLGTDAVLHATGVFPGWGEPMSDALFLLATAYEWQDQLNEAQKLYRTIVSVNENDLEAWEQVAKLDARRANEGAISRREADISSATASLLVGLARP